ncbi:MAG TPA: hypothetical protein EYP53_08575 [Candidatus Latescibacteria bacterium]|nr:hypothetical protein [Candidatus Latescibacterota bacterium]
MKFTKISLLIVIALSFMASGLFVLEYPAQAMNEEEAIDFIRSCRNSPDKMPNLRLIYLKLRLLQAVNKAEVDTEKAKYVNYVHGCLNEDGGYGFWPQDVSTVEATYQALVVLDMLGSRPQHPRRTAEFLRCRLPSIESRARRYVYVKYGEELYQTPSSC